MAIHICIPLSLLFFALYLFYEYLSWHFDKWRPLGIRSPPPKLIYGNFPSIINGKRNVVYDHQDVYNKYKLTDRIIGVFTSREPNLFLIDPKLAIDVMVTNFGKFRDNLSASWISPKSSEEIIRINPFWTLDKDGWKTRRQDILSGVTQHKLNAAYPLWQSSAKKMRQYLQEKISQSETKKVAIDSRNLSYRFTADIMSDFLWGVESKAFTEAPGHISDIAVMMGKMLAHLLESIGQHFFFSWAPFLRNFFYKRSFPEETDRFFSTLTKDAMALRSNDAQSQKRDDFLNHVMQLQEKKQISHSDAVGYIMTCQLDGYETSATVLMHTLYYLARYPKVQEKLREEIRRNIQSDGFASVEVLNSLPYLDQCVHETLRLVTPIPWFARICTEATTIQMGADRSVPVDEGTVVVIPVFSYHHDAEYFPQPYVYNPDRFDNGLHQELTKKGIFMPFGNGPRICLGMRMGLLEVKTGLVEILQKYRLKCLPQTVEEKPPDSSNFILGLAGDLSLSFEDIAE